MPGGSVADMTDGPSPWRAMAARMHEVIAADERAAWERVEAAKRVRAGVDRVRGVSESDGVRVEVDSAGRLVSLEVADEVAGLDGKTIAGKIVEVARQAQRDAAAQVAVIAAAEFGEDSELTARVRVEADARLGPEPEPAGSAKPAWSPLMIRPGAGHE